MLTPRAASKIHYYRQDAINLTPSDLLRSLCISRWTTSCTG